MAWEHTGGGCLVGGRSKYPCDDDYENTDTGEAVNVETTKERHFNMPNTVPTLAALKKISGVGPIKRLGVWDEERGEYVKAEGRGGWLNGLGSWG